MKDNECSKLLPMSWPKSALDVEVAALSPGERMNEARWVFVDICSGPSGTFFPTYSPHQVYKCHSTQKPAFLMILMPFQSRSFSLFPVTGVVVLP